jgi:hypothetical protein
LGSNSNSGGSPTVVNQSAPTQIFTSTFLQLENANPITNPFDITSADSLFYSDVSSLNQAFGEYINDSPQDAAKFAFALIGGNFAKASSILDNDYSCGMITHNVWQTVGGILNSTLNSC